MRTIIILLSILMIQTSCKEKCEFDPNLCASNSYLILDDKDCQCTCLFSNYFQYLSPIDTMMVCVPPPNQGLDPYETYIHDYIPGTGLNFCPRRIFTVNISFEDTLVDNLKDYPHQGFMSYYGMPRNDPFNYTGGVEAFYLKSNGSQDTLFFDKPVGFWPFNAYWPCGNGLIGKDGPIFSGYAVRSADALDWTLKLYPPGTDNFDIANGIDPDTIVQLHMTRVW